MENWDKINELICICIDTPQGYPEVTDIKGRDRNSTEARACSKIIDECFARAKTTTNSVLRDCTIYEKELKQQYPKLETTSIQMLLMLFSYVAND